MKRVNRKPLEMMDQATAESGLRIMQPCGCGVGQERRKRKEESANRNALDAGHPELIQATSESALQIRTHITCRKS